MTFLAPLALLALLVPVVIYLVHWFFGSRRRLRVSAIFLWANLPRASTGRTRRRWPPLSLLLLLQLLAAALLAVALARPAVPSDPPRHLALVLDASGSMQATDVAPTRFDAARASGLDRLGSLQPSDLVSIVRAGREATLLASGTPERARAALAAAQPGAGGAAIREALALASSQVAATPERRAQIVLLTDAAFPPLDPIGPLAAPVDVVAVGGGSDNQAVTGVSVRMDPSGRGQTAFVELANEADHAVRVPMRLSADGAPLDERQIDMAGRTRARLNIPLPVDARRVSVRLLGHDSLALDDVVETLAPGGPPRDVVLLGRASDSLRRALESIPGLRVRPSATLPGTGAASGAGTTLGAGMVAGSGAASGGGSASGAGSAYGAGAVSGRPALSGAGTASDTGTATGAGGASGTRAGPGAGTVQGASAGAGGASGAGGGEGAQKAADLTVLVGSLPAQLPAGALLLVDPPATSGRLLGVGLGNGARVQDAHPLLQGLDLVAMQSETPSVAGVPGWAHVVLGTAQGPLIMEGKLEGRPVVALTFDPAVAGLEKSLAYPLLISNATAYLLAQTDMPSTAMAEAFDPAESDIAPRPVPRFSWAGGTTSAPGGARAGAADNGSSGVGDAGIGNGSSGVRDGGADNSSSGARAGGTDSGASAAGLNAALAQGWRWLIGLADQGRTSPDVVGRWQWLMGAALVVLGAEWLVFARRG